LDDWVNNSLNFLLFIFILFFGSIGIGLDPRLGIIQSLSDLGLVLIRDFLTEFFRVIDLSLDTEDIVIQLILGIDLFLSKSILFSKLFSLFDHSFDFLRSKSTLVVVNLDLLRFT
jgi:hypothetical protein